MMRAIERAWFTAESDTRRRKSAPSLRQIESRLMKNILAQSLALEVVRNSDKSTSQLLSELMEIEMRVGEFVGEALKQATTQHKNKVDLRGALAGALSFIPIPKSSGKRLTQLSWRKIALTWVTKVLEEPVKKSAQEVPQRPDIPHIDTASMGTPTPALASAGKKKTKTRKTTRGVKKARGKRHQAKRQRRKTARK